jgi:hypothetical protein
MQKLTLVNCNIDSDSIANNFACDFTVETAGDGIWGCEAGRKIKVTGITIIVNCYDGEFYTMVNVEHDTTWEIYTDTGFESAISEAVGFAVTFTEQGMQEDNYASMES